MNTVAESNKTVEIYPTGVPVRDLPMGVVHDVIAVLQAHGLRIHDMPGSAIYADVIMALGAIVEAVPVEYGGRAL